MDTTFKYVCDAYSVEYSGSEEFLESRLPELVRDLTNLSNEAITAPHKDADTGRNNSALPGLSVFLTELKEKTQVNKFLATAAWLQLSRGLEDMRTGDVARAMREHRHTPPTNSSDCLGKNVRKGYCQTLGRNPIRFHVTSEGMAQLGLPV